MADRLRGSGVFLQILAPLMRILQQSAVLEAAGLPVVLDHFASARASDVDCECTKVAARVARKYL